MVVRCMDNGLRVMVDGFVGEHTTYRPCPKDVIVGYDVLCLLIPMPGWVKEIYAMCIQKCKKQKWRHHQWKHGIHNITYPLVN